MPIILVGLNHRTAPVALREQLSLAGYNLTSALAELPVYPSIYTGDPVYGDLWRIPTELSEGAILSTCNRLEVYAVTHEIQMGQAIVENFLSRLQGVTPGALKPHLYSMHDEEAVTHLARVAAGLDSLILGEPQILGQVSDAYASARTVNAAGPILSRLFAAAIRAGKRTRTETDISRHTTSVSHAAAQLAESRLAESRLGGLDGAHVLVIGAGEMAELAARALRMRGAGRISCINRTYQRAEALAEKVDGQAVGWNGLTDALRQADVVISATGAPHTVLHVDDVAPALPARADRPLILVDIAVPRDIEAEVGSLPGVTCYDMDDLRTALDEHAAQREAAVPLAETIVEEESAAFGRWLSSLEVVPVIADLRAWADQIAGAEVERALESLKDAGPEERKAVEMLAHRLVNKLLHAPTVRLREQAESGDGYPYAHLVRELFDLGESQYEPNHAHKNDGWQMADGPRAGARLMADGR